MTRQFKVSSGAVGWSLFNALIFFICCLLFSWLITSDVDAAIRHEMARQDWFNHGMQIVQAGDHPVKEFKLKLIRSYRDDNQ